MEKKQAQDFVKSILGSAFDAERFELLVRNLLNDVESKSNSYSGNMIADAFKDHISHYRRVGKYTDPEGESMDILIVQTKTVGKLERTRTALRNFVVRQLKQFDKQYALVAFYSREDGGADWRLSLVKIDYESLRSETGRIKIHEDLVPARRFSFLVGEQEHSYTAQKQLLPLLVNDHSNPLIVKEKDADGSVEGAFGIETVTDEFFEQYKDLFTKLVKYFSTNKTVLKILAEAEIDTSRFTKKLLGQIVFLYFLQKKGWLGVPKDAKMGEGSKRFMQDRFEQVVNSKGNYFNDFLRYLFYAALAREHNDQGVKYYFKQLGCKIPFLNGGLFEAEYDWEKAKLTIPNYLFRNDEKTKGGDKGTGVLDVFDRYNFTIKEDEPLEKEVAVDPEMLGKVFENMLEITERKSKGAFYTPREIVHYMCQESLIHYLDNTVNDYTETYQPLDGDQGALFAGTAHKKGTLKMELTRQDGLHVPKADLEMFIREGHYILEHDTAVSAKGKETSAYKFKLPDTIRDNAELLDRALADVKICDPAIGSGAFPVGVLHEIVTARKVLVPYLSNKYIKLLQDNAGISDSDTMPSGYYFKRHAIQESIYGVDIDASAIDIARLRLWLSMIVDEEDYDTIDALPNLDYKIVYGNSLIGIPENAMRDLNIEEEIEQLKDEFFNQTNEVRKIELRQIINQKIRLLLDSAEVYAGYKIDFDFRTYFSEVWHKRKREGDKRKERDGFDMIIGNPPYVGMNKIEYKDVLKQMKYKTFASTGDLYTLFYERGNQLLKPKGNLCFITSNKWMNASYGEKTRKYFIEKTNPLVLIDFAKVRIFPSATVFVNILLFERAEFDGHLPAVAVEGTRIPQVSLEQYFQEKHIVLDTLSEDVWKISSSKGLAINNRIETLGAKLTDWKGIEFFRGVTTGLNKAFHIDSETAKKLVDEDQKCEEIIHPLLRGKDIKRWAYDSKNVKLIFTKQGTKIGDYPKIESYLRQYYAELVPKKSSNQKLGRKPGSYKWFEIQDNTAYHKFFFEPKIVWIEISDKANYAYDESGHFLTNSAYFISGENLKYLICVLNSSVADYYFFQITAKIAGGRKRYTKQYVEQVPIPQISKDAQLPFEVVADYVLNAKRLCSDLIFSFWEQLLDAMVFELYFEEELLSANKLIISNLGNLQPLTDYMSDEKKLALIQKEFERLYDPNHPVRNNLETVDSIEEVRIIKEALK